MRGSRCAGRLRGRPAHSSPTTGSGRRFIVAAGRIVLYRSRRWPAPFPPRRRAGRPPVEALRLRGDPKSTTPLSSFNLRLTVSNRSSRAVRGGRVFVGLTKSGRARATVRRLKTRSLPPYRAGRSSRTRCGCASRPTAGARTGRSSAWSPPDAGRPAGSAASSPCRPRRGRTCCRPDDDANAGPDAGAAGRPAGAAITPQALTAHTNVLADIAAANGNRAAGTQGCEDSWPTSPSASRRPAARRAWTLRVHPDAENAPTRQARRDGRRVSGKEFASMTFSSTGDSTGQAGPRRRPRPDADAGDRNGQREHLGVRGRGLRRLHRRATSRWSSVARCRSWPRRRTR